MQQNPVYAEVSAASSEAGSISRKYDTSAHMCHTSNRGVRMSLFHLALTLAVPPMACLCVHTHSHTQTGSQSLGNKSNYKR